MKTLIIVLFLFFSINSLNASENENVLKGVMLERISQFITYERKDNFVICTYKDKKINSSFKQLFLHRTYQNNSIKVQNISSLNKISSCDILYVENPSSKLLDSIVATRGEYTLLASNDVDYLDDGFMLALYLKKDKIKFAINQQALLDASLKVNYRLLRVASKVVNPVKY